MKLFWLDLETTGLDPTSDHILEIAVSEADLLDPFNAREVYYAVLGFTQTLNDGVDPFVREMYTKNGLLAECATSETYVSQVYDDLVNLFPIVDDKDEKPTLAGNTGGARTPGGGSIEPSCLRREFAQALLSKHGDAASTKTS